MKSHKILALCCLAWGAGSFSTRSPAKIASSPAPPQCRPRPSFTTTSCRASNVWGSIIAADVERYGLTDPSKRRRIGGSSATALRASSSFAVPASSLEKDLSKDERTTVRVVRNAGPSVAFVTSLLLAPSPPNLGPSRNESSADIEPRNQRRGGGGGTGNKTSDALPNRGRPLGSGSGFVVDSSGYLCTNYHVVEAAYVIQQTEQRRQEMTAAFWGNVSSWVGRRSSGAPRSGGGAGCRTDRPGRPNAQVYVRIDSQTRYQPCRIVDVVPELDVAVLKIENRDGVVDSLQPLAFGSSGSLLVGQQLIAIGNPFGLDNTVTTGVVSALHREIQVGGSQLGMPRRTIIRNCIQTDCAINPGNSGGPLLNRQGSVIGMNTAIFTTSGSSAGIGFAVPSDLIQPAVRRIVRADRQRLRPTPYLGVQIVRCPAAPNSTSILASKNWIARVQRGSPAAEAEMRSLRIDGSTGRVEYGDAVVAIGGNSVPTFAELQAEIDRRKVGEQVQVTLEDQQGNRRVVYLTLTDATSQRA
jgi:S1-C subfamily serine protease